MNKPTMSDELQAMVAIEAALSGLEDADAKGRILRWAAEKFGVTLPTGSENKSDGSKDTDLKIDKSELGGGGGGVGGPPVFDSLADFYDAASPSSDTEKALVVSYWKQFHDGVADVETQGVNTQLKHLGHGVSNITRAFELLKAEKPASIVQTKKDGSSQQARKKFKVTAVGKKRVESMLSRSET